MICGLPEEADDESLSLHDRLSDVVKTKSTESVARLCDALAPMFGLRDGPRLKTILEDAGFVLTSEVVGQLLLLHGRRRAREPLIFEGDTGVGKSFLLELFSVLVNQDPSIVFSGRDHLVAVLRAVALRHTEGQHAEAWGALRGLTFSSDATEIIKAVRSVVDLDPQPHAREIGAALGVYFSVQCTSFPLMRDGAGENLLRLIHGVGNLRAEPQRAEAFETARAADVVPREVLDSGKGLNATVGREAAASMDAELALEQEEEAAEKAAKWSEAQAEPEGAGAGQWRDLERYAELEKVGCFLFFLFPFLP
jgi:hypothetical protein